MERLGKVSEWNDDRGFGFIAPLDQITALVRSAIGFDEARGDQVEIANLQFADRPGLTAAALQAAAIRLDAPTAHVHVDNEQQCLRVDGDNWQQRLTRLRSSKH